MQNKKQNTTQNPKRIFISTILWLIIWQFAALLIGNSLFLPSPADTFLCLFRLAATTAYWQSIGNTVVNILLGFFLSVIIGTVMAYVSFMIPSIKEFISIPFGIIRAVPVASFIILALLWVNSSKLHFLIALLMALPIIYFSVYESLGGADTKLLEMASLYQVPKFRQLIYLNIPVAFQASIPAYCNALALSWKAGIAAEVIGISRKTIGNSLNQAKIYLVTDELFA